MSNLGLVFSFRITMPKKVYTFFGEVPQKRGSRDALLILRNSKIGAELRVALSYNYNVGRLLSSGTGWRNVREILNNEG